MLNKVRVKFESLLLYRVHKTCNLCTWIFRFPFVFCDNVMEVTQNTEFTVRNKLMTKSKPNLSNSLFGSNAQGNRRSRIGHTRHIFHKTHQARLSQVTNSRLGINTCMHLFQEQINTFMPTFEVYLIEHLIFQDNTAPNCFITFYILKLTLWFWLIYIFHFEARTLLHAVLVLC